MDFTQRAVGFNPPTPRRRCGCSETTNLVAPTSFGRRECASAFRRGGRSSERVRRPRCQRGVGGAFRCSWWSPWDGEESSDRDGAGGRTDGLSRQVGARFRMVGSDEQGLAKWKTCWGDRMTRRGLLCAAAASAALSACRGIRGLAATPGSSYAGGTVSVVSTAPVTHVPGVAAAFHRTHTDVDLRWSATPPSSPHIVELLAIPAVVRGTAKEFADLSLALRAQNFESNSLVAGAMSAWSWQGRVLAVPFSEVPWGIRWRKDVFAAAGLARPKPNWTFGDFAQTCGLVQKVVRSGRIKGVTSTLGPITSPAELANKPGQKHVIGPGGVGFPTAMQFPGLWQAFVLGFGGTIAKGGRFVLTDSQSELGLRALTDLVQEYSVSVSEMIAIPTNTPLSEWLSAVQNLYGMTFDIYPGSHLSGISSEWEWARMPRFPIQPVIPTVAQAIALQKGAASRPPESDSRLAAATAALGTWLNAPEAFELTKIPSARVDVASQSTFWSAPWSAQAAVLGDWRNFRDAFSGFPTLPSQDYVQQAVSEVLSGDVDLQTALARANQRLNAEVVL